MTGRGWSRLVASNSLTRLILSVKSGIIKNGEYPQGDKMTSRKLLVEWVMPFCRSTESCLMRATRCLSLKRKALNYWVKHNHIVPHNLWDPFEGDHCHPGTAFNCKAMCGGSRWESKADRVNLCEVRGVSLPHNIGRIKWRLISRCYQH